MIWSIYMMKIKFLLEVKAATNTFYMSLTEYNFAKSNSSNYELYC